MIHPAVCCPFKGYSWVVALSFGVARELTDSNDFIAGLSQQKCQEKRCLMKADGHQPSRSDLC